MKRVLAIVLFLCMISSVCFADDNLTGIIRNYNYYADSFNIPKIIILEKLEDRNEIEQDGLTYRFSNDGKAVDIIAEDEAHAGDLLMAASIMIIAYGGEVENEDNGILLYNYQMARRGGTYSLGSTKGLEYSITRTENGSGYIFSLVDTLEEMPLRWHYPFGIDENSTAEEIESHLKKAFSVGSSDSLSVKGQYLYGVPVDYVSFEKGEKDAYIRIRFDEEAINAADILSLFDALLRAYGSPDICEVKETGNVTFGGAVEKNLDMSYSDLEDLQRAWDQFRLDGFCSWGNVTFRFYSRYSYSSFSDASQWAVLEYALNEQSLDWKVKTAFRMY